ncbi:MAG TPA: NAD-dependent epimerase/dehydratase family protein [Ktedonobacterales bacterium]|nr:NAD-dependent epimerase/dehydratase family protein [Ktedonobacterales bacterium]
MTSDGQLHVVLGASGGVGSAVVRELANQGKRVRAVNRGGRMDAPDGVEVRAGDMRNLDSVRAVCDGAAMVYLCGNAPYDKWAEQFPAIMAGGIAGASAAGAKLVFSDNLYLYPPTTQAITEDLPWAPVTRKGKVRKQLDETLMAAHASGTVRATIGRASDYYGPFGVNSATGGRFFTQLLGGKPVQWLANLDRPHTLSYLADFARGLIVLGERDEALGQAWHIPAAEPLTARQFIQLAAEVADVPARPAAVSPLMLRVAGAFSPVIRETMEMCYEFAEPFIMDASKFTRAFGGTPTTHREALGETIVWYRQHLSARK